MSVSTDLAQDNYELSNEAAKIGTDFSFKRKIVWKNAIGFLVLHIAACYGLYRGVFYAMWATIAWGAVLQLLAGEGVGLAAHRLYCHRSFKATPFLHLLSIFCNTLAGQNCLWIWIRDHRQHHKFSDTDADPHNATRGFFFSHVGWLMSRKHPLVIEKGKTIDMSDIEANPWIMFQKEHYKLLYLICAVVIPVGVPMYFWNEGWINALFFPYFFRSVYVLNVTWSINSVAHLWGDRPYDKNIKPVQSPIVAFFVNGEGWHNFHHCFPWDYRTAEVGSNFNWTTYFIDFFHKLGFVYDLKCASPEVIKARILRTGDGSHHTYGNRENGEVKSAKTG